MKQIILSTLLLLSGTCAFSQAEFTSTDGTGRKPHPVGRKAANKIPVFFEKGELPPGAKRIGIISAKFSDEAEAMQEAKVEAARYGGDAIVYVKNLEQGLPNDGRRRKKAERSRYGYHVYEYPETVSDTAAQ